MSWTPDQVAGDATESLGAVEAARAVEVVEDAAPLPAPSPAPDIFAPASPSPSEATVGGVPAAAMLPVASGALPFANFERKLFVPPPPPKPKPIIVPERTGTGCRTEGLSIDHAVGGAVYISIRPVQGAPQRVYVCASALRTLIDLAAAPGAEPGRLWKALCDLPIERPLPNRQREDELRVLLTRFGNELRNWKSP